MSLRSIDCARHSAKWRRAVLGATLLSSPVLPWKHGCSQYIPSSWCLIRSPRVPQWTWYRTRAGCQLSGFQLHALKNAQHYCQIPVVRILRFGQLFVREMGIQVADGRGWFLFHPPTLDFRRKYGRRSDLPELASLLCLGMIGNVAFGAH